MSTYKEIQEDITDAIKSYGAVIAGTWQHCGPEEILAMTKLLDEAKTCFADMLCPAADCTTCRAAEAWMKRVDLDLEPKGKTES